MNILLIAATILLLIKMVVGFKKGMVKQIVSLVSLIILAVVAALVAGGVSHYVEQNYLKVIIVVILIGAISIVHHILGLVFFSAKLFSKLPVVSWADKLLGIIIGAIEAVLILWMMYTIIMVMDMGALGTRIIEYTRDSEILRWFYEHNYLAMFLGQFSEVFEKIKQFL